MRCVAVEQQVSSPVASGGNGAQSPVSFTVANADALFRDGPSDSAFQRTACVVTVPAMGF